MFFFFCVEISSLGSIIRWGGRLHILFRPGDWTFFTQCFALDLDLTQGKNFHFLEPRARMSTFRHSNFRHRTFLPWAKKKRRQIYVNKRNFPEYFV